MQGHIWLMGALVPICSNQFKAPRGWKLWSLLPMGATCSALHHHSICIHFANWAHSSLIIYRTDKSDILNAFLSHPPVPISMATRSRRKGRCIIIVFNAQSTVEVIAGRYLVHEHLLLSFAIYTVSPVSKVNRAVFCSSSLHPYRFVFENDDDEEARR